MSLVKIDPLKLTAEVPEKMAPWVKVGQSLTLAVEAMPDAAIAGRIARLSPAVNPQTRSFPLEGRVPNPDGRLKPGGLRACTSSPTWSSTCLLCPRWPCSTATA